MVVDRERLRVTFDEDAERYDRARPNYPVALVDDLVNLAGIGPGTQVLEIGAGTGKLTVPLAERGSQITAVELGRNMTEVARQNLARIPTARVVVSSFEDWTLPESLFDVVVSATAWHWLDPNTRVVKAADALRIGGALAIVTTHHIAGGDEGFFADVQDCYESWDPATPLGIRLPSSDDIPAAGAELVQSGRFGPPSTRRYEQEITYSTKQYLDLLLTYSGHRALGDRRRTGLIDCIAHLIDTRYAGKVTKRYLYQLAVACRLR